MVKHNCENCRFRKCYENKPHSLLGKIWKWHAGWCPGWQKYLSSLPEIEREEVIKKLFHTPVNHG